MWDGAEATTGSGVQGRRAARATLTGIRELVQASLERLT